MMRPELRQRLEAIVEAAIAILDQIDGDSDFEVDDDLEPSLGIGIVFDAAGRWHWSSDDREGHDASDEPDMAYSAQTMNPAPLRAKRISRRAA